jgi:hypothetical protein
MLALRLFDGSAPSLSALVEPLFTSAPLREELVQLCEVLDERITVASQVTDVPADWPLARHSRG